MPSLSERLIELAAGERKVAAGLDMRPEDTANGQYAQTADEARERIAELEAALRSVAQQCETVIFNCAQHPAANDRHLSSWRSVRDYANQALGRGC